MRNHLHALCLCILCTLLLAACGGTTRSSSVTRTPSNVTLNVFAAASLKESFNAIATKYHQAHPNITVTPSFNGSQILEQQIGSGAAADVLASGDQVNMQKASNANLVSGSQLFVKNILTVIVPANNPGNITSLKDLGKKGVKIDIEAPTVPAGKYSLQVLDKMAQSSHYGPTYLTAVKPNFVSPYTDITPIF